MAEQSTKPAKHQRHLSLDEPPVRQLNLTSPPPTSANSPSNLDSPLQEEDGGWETMHEESQQQDDGQGEAGDGYASFTNEPEAADNENEGEMESAFEAVSLGEGEPTTVLQDSSRSADSPSPAPTSTPPTSPATTAATTVGGPSSSSLSVPPLPSSTAAESGASSTSPPPPSDVKTVPSPSPKPEELTPKKPLSTKTPTAMQRFMSMTRQRDLPPKDKEEEVRRLLSLPFPRSVLNSLRS